MAINEYLKGLSDDELERELDDIRRVHADNFRAYNSFDYWSQKEFEEWERGLRQERKWIGDIEEEQRRRDKEQKK